MGAKVGKLLIAIGCIVGSLAIVPFIAVPAHDTVLTIGGSIFIGAGVTEIFSCLFGKASWGEFWNKLGTGALIGLITTGASFIAIGCVKQLGAVATQLENRFPNISKNDISVLLSAGSAIFSTGVTNLIEGGPMMASAFFGGLLTYGIVNGFGKFYEKAVGYTRKLCQKTLQHMSQDSNGTSSAINNTLSVPRGNLNQERVEYRQYMTPSTRTDNISEVLESRIWNEGARIYSARDAIETFRSQSERYNCANIAPEFENEVDYNSMHEYVYAYARSDNSISVASSSLHAPLTNMYDTRATNENFHVPQPNWSGQSNQDSTNMTNELQSETVNENLPVKLHPIICWNTDEQKYTFSNSTEWPVFPDKAKVIGFIGTKKSGRTTAIHSLLFELGYYLTEEQLAKSLLPIGVMMYVLTRDDLIILDCCDIADSVTAKAGNLLSGYLLEFFTYIASCHLVIHIAIPQKTESDHSMLSEQLSSYIHSKTKLQLLWANTVQAHGAPMLTVLLRGSKQQCEEFDLTKINLFSSRANETNEDKIVFTQGFQDSKAFTWQYIPEEMITANSSNDNFAVSKAILERVKDETEPHGLSVNMHAILAGVTNESGADSNPFYPFYNGIVANWQYLFTEIMSNSILSRSVTDIINNDVIQEADEKIGGLIQEYVNSVNKLVENSSALAIDFKALCEDFKRRLDVEKDKPDDEKDPIIGFKIGIEIAKCLLESSKSETNLQVKDNLISWGLHGLTLIHNRSLKSFEHTWVKLCIKTYNILDLLNDPVIYNVHWHCWNFLSFASFCGFKLELVEWQILGRALHCLKTSANKPRFHFHVLNCLLNLRQNLIFQREFVLQLVTKTTKLCQYN